MRFDPVPDEVRRSVLGWFSEAGERWLASIPVTVERLVDAWSLRRTGPPFEGGTHSYVLPVERADGSPAALKVIYRDVENAAEPTGLRAYAGDGAVRLFEYDSGTGAMLLELAAPGAPLLEHDFPGLDERDAARRRVAIACGLYGRLWRIPPPLDGYPDVPTADDMLAAWAARYGAPSPAILAELGAHRIERAIELCDFLKGPAELGIANRDTHLRNILSSGREPWLLIDPKPYLADRAFDAGFFVFKQVFHGPLGASELIHAVSDGLGADLERVRAWAVLRSIEQADEAAGTEYGAASLRTADAIDAA